MMYRGAQADLAENSESPAAARTYRAWCLMRSGQENDRWSLENPARWKGNLVHFCLNAHG